MSTWYQFRPSPLVLKTVTTDLLHEALSKPKVKEPLSSQMYARILRERMNPTPKDQYLAWYFDEWMQGPGGAPVTDDECIFGGITSR
jgi:hypothetical protein